MLLYSSFHVVRKTLFLIMRMFAYRKNKSIQLADIFSKTKRSEVMSRVPRKDSVQEILVRKFLFSNGFRFKKNVKNLPGSPDIVLPKYKTVIFINGCFWHGHSCRAARLPTSNSQFWVDKIENNKRRDRKKNYQLKKLGWKIITIWQCKLNGNEKMNKSLTKLLDRIQVL